MIFNKQLIKDNIIINNSIIDNIQDLLKSDEFKIQHKYFFNHQIIEKYQYLQSVKLYFGTYESILESYKELLTDKQLNDELKSNLKKYTEAFKYYFKSLHKYLLLKDDNNNYIDETSRTNKLYAEFFFLIESKCGNLEYNYFNNIKGFDAVLYYKTNTFGMDTNKSIKHISKVFTNTPYMSNTYANKRHGLFRETDYMIDDNCIIDEINWVKAGFFIGKLKALVIVNQKYLNHLIGLSVLFQSISSDEEDYDIKLYFGNDIKELDAKIYTALNGKMYGSIFDHPKNDYFGYMKKILLTMHNIYHIKNNHLPIHGAMVKIEFINDTTHNVVIIGDSGAGKSESLEAFRTISSNLIKKMTIIFDDMGIFQKENSVIKAYGTEIGAFVRSDDLDTSYSINNITEAVFINTDRVNARLIIPISKYEDIIRGEKIDYVFYANNYKDMKNPIKIFESIDEAIPVFEKGERVAKGTTSEMGKVSNYFANPFGPVQMEEVTKNILRDYFESLHDDGVVFGELYTKLAISGYEVEGPRQVANKLLELFMENS